MDSYSLFVYEKIYRFWAPLDLENSVRNCVHLFRKFESISAIYGAEFKNDGATPPLAHMFSWRSIQLIRNRGNCNFTLAVIYIVCQNVYSS
jgi:hypothetical protein